MGGSPLLDQVRGLLGRVRAAHQAGPGAMELDRAAGRLDEPLRVALAGRIKAGKSTLLNALVGQQLAATDAGECTRIVTWFRDGHTYRVQAFPRGAPPRQLPPGPSGALIDGALGGLQAHDVERLVVDWPSATLRAMTLVDTPGMDSLSTEVAGRSEAALGVRDGGVSEVDAVVYLMRHVHASDVRFLEAFSDDPGERRPINTLGVLARADEVGHARTGALESAAAIAARYRDDPRVRALCQTVLPVAGLLAVTATTLREDEFRALGALAGAPEEETTRLLLTAGRFATAETGIAALPPHRRAEMLDRFGLYGLRLSVQLLRDPAAGITTAGALSRELTRRSGLTELREALTVRFAARADVLRARSALRVVDDVLRRYPNPATGGLRRELEQVTAGAHEFAEIRLLDGLRVGTLMLTEAERGDAERLLGAEGTHALTRLGLPAGVGPDEVSRAATTALGRWQRRAEHPASPRDVREAARVVVRTCEGLVLAARGVTPGPPPAMSNVGR